MNPLYFDSVANLLHQAAEFLTGSWLNMIVSSLLGLGGLDVVMRLIRTDKPVSVLIGLRGLIAAGRAISRGVIHVLNEFDAAAIALDRQVSRLIPQRLNAQPEPGVGSTDSSNPTSPPSG